jgi:hypothetical protein
MYRVSHDAVSRHFATHIRPSQARMQAVAREQVAQEAAREDNVLAQLRQRQERVERLAGVAEGLIAKAAAEKDWRGATAAVQAAVSASREVRTCLELVAKLIGELDERPQINVLLAPEWVQVRAQLLMALRPYPEARVAVAARLASLEAA